MPFWERLSTTEAEQNNDGSICMALPDALLYLIDFNCLDLFHCVWFMEMHETRARNAIVDFPAEDSLRGSSTEHGNHPSISPFSMFRCFAKRKGDR